MEKIKNIFKERISGFFLIFLAILIIPGLSLNSRLARSENKEQPAGVLAEEQVLGETDNNSEESVAKISEKVVENSSAKVSKTDSSSEEINKEKVVASDAEGDKYENLKDQLKKYCGKSGSDNRKKCKEYCLEAKIDRKKSEQYGDLYEKYCTIETTIIIKSRSGNTIAKYNHFRSSSLEEITVFDLTKKASKEEKFSFDYVNSSFGAFICVIHGTGAGNCLENYPGYYWRLSVNGKPSDTGASIRKVSDGDEIEWKYTDEY